MSAETFQKDGFLIARALYPAEEMLDWKTRMVQLLRAEDHWNKKSNGVQVWMADVLDPYLKDRMQDSCVVDILRQIIGPDVEFLSGKAVYKDRRTTFSSPWHQDWYYWKGATKISVWIALDDATPENGCLKMLAGSHHKRYKVKQVRDDIGFGWRLHNEEVVDLPEVTLSVDRGDVVFFHDQTLHASYPNTGSADRFSFISTYRNASVKDEATSWKHPLLVSGTSVNAQG